MTTRIHVSHMAKTVAHCKKTASKLPNMHGYWKSTKHPAPQPTLKTKMIHHTIRVTGDLVGESVREQQEVELDQPDASHAEHRHNSKGLEGMQ